MIKDHGRNICFRNLRDAQRYVGIFFLIVLFECWLAGQANSDHMWSECDQDDCDHVIRMWSGWLWSCDQNVIRAGRAKFSAWLTPYFLQHQQNPGWWAGPPGPPGQTSPNLHRLRQNPRGFSYHQKSHSLRFCSSSCLLFLSSSEAHAA